MAASVRNTGTRFRYDADDLRWHARVRTTETATDGEQFKEFVGVFVTLVELLAWIADIFDGLADAPDTTVAGHPDPGITVSGPAP